MMRVLFFTLFGYLCGGILFADLFSKLFRKDILTPSKDKNPGVANAFMYGGFRCGLCTLLGDVLKGFLPVFLLALTTPVQALDWRYALALAAPVLGHAFPVFFRFRGGKGIAATFGCLLGLLPYSPLPFALFAACFIFFSVVLKISPHFYRTIFAYLTTAILLVVLGVPGPVRAAFVIMTATVCARLHLSREERERMTVSLVWKH